MTDLQKLLDNILERSDRPYLSDLEVVELMGFAAAKGIWIESMEAFLLESDAETPLLEYSIVGVSRIPEKRNINRISAASKVIKDLLYQAQIENGTIKYLIWLDSE